jgi:hypothetical protein
MPVAARLRLRSPRRRGKKGTFRFARTANGGQAGFQTAGQALQTQFQAKRLGAFVQVAKVKPSFGIIRINTQTRRTYPVAAKKPNKFGGFAVVGRRTTNDQAFWAKFA